MFPDTLEANIEYLVWNNVVLGAEASTVVTENLISRFAKSNMIVLKFDLLGRSLVNLE